MLEQLTNNKSNTNITIREYPETERPYEKCMEYGASSLSDSELLAVILRSGSSKMSSVDLSKKILTTHPTISGLVSLHYLSYSDLIKIHGIGKVKAIQIQCVAELSKRMAKQERKQLISLDSPKTVANYYMEEMRHLTKEHMKIALFDCKNGLISDFDIATGTVNAVITSPREIFIEALKKEAVYIVMLHNHPSGDPTPSEQDLITTKRVEEIGQLLGIQLIDHIIIGNHKYISLKEQGIM
ncbi:MAG: DNA repair protein RadC [Lachnospiraceae bacterium]|nr:DNA repair protein RadC [Lachnospiraceae bacterium]MEE1341585.1 DNA repair protein RadC [Lachnospiraceae bacterium]